MTPDEQAFWDACFLTLLKHDTNNTIEDCMDNADLALAERRERTGQAEQTESPLAGFGEFVERHVLYVNQHEDGWDITGLNGDIIADSAPNLAIAYARAKEALE